ncbi:MAG: hypothetical protein DU481_14245 [Nitrosomonas sp.]|uniref:DUF7453 family protein n=1 Tax=Nitrosomonas sp. TaxID=42353 RepID=UPI0032EDED50
MNLTRLSLVISFSVLSFFATQVLAEIQKIARIGEPAIGFPDGMVFADVTNPIIGGSGHIAFTGLVSNGGSLRFAVGAMWTGLPGQLNVIMKQDDTPVGFPESVKLTGFFDTRPVVTESGAVGVLANLKGADSVGVLAHIDGTTYGIMKTGDQAVGFPEGSLVKEILDFAFTDAGMIVTAEVTGVTSRRRGVWLWNRDGLQTIPSPIAGCHFGFPVSYASINESGEVAFTASLIKDDDSFCSPKAGVFKWSHGSSQLLMKNNDPVPGMLDARFLNVNLESKSASPMINNEGLVVFSAELTEGTRQKMSVWVTDGLNEPKLLFLNEEILESDLDKLRIGDSSLNSFLDDNRLILKMDRGINGDSLMTGKFRESQPYHSLNETGKTQLTEIAATGEQPRGFDADWRFTDFQGTFGKTGQFVVLGAAKNSLNRSVLEGFWRSDESRGLRLAAIDGMKISVDGEEHLLQFISVTNGISAPRYRSKWVSKNNEIIFNGFLGEGGGGIFLLTDDSKEQKIFNLAEQLFPEYFSSANVDDQLLEGFVYRYYPATKTYIGIKNGEVFVLGDVFGSGPQRIDTIENTLQLLEGLAAGT